MNSKEEARFIFGLILICLLSGLCAFSVAKGEVKNLKVIVGALGSFITPVISYYFGVEKGKKEKE